MAVERLVADASFVLEALLPSLESWRRGAVELIERIALRDIEAHAPWVFSVELAHVATRAVRGKRLPADAAAIFLARIDGLRGLRVDPAGGVSASLVLHESAIAWHVGAYDAIYLDLAARLGVPVATRDRGMATAARSAGVALY